MNIILFLAVIWMSSMMSAIGLFVWHDLKRIGEVQEVEIE